MPIFATEDTAEQLEQLQDVVAAALAEARRLGASDAEAAVGSSQGLEVGVRLGAVETVEHTRDNGLSVTVHCGARKGSATTSDLRLEAVRDTAAAAMAIARQTEEDPCGDLPEAALLASDAPDLDLYHPWPLSVDQATVLALACEDAARACDPRIANSEGAMLSSQRGLRVVGNSRGFIGGYPTTRHGLDCAVIAEQNGQMQRDAWRSSARAPADLEAAAAVGERAGRRTLARLGARRLSTRKAPVLFQAEVATGLLRSLIGAIRGASIYRRSSFLIDRVGERIFPEFVRIHEQPRLPRGLASAPYDGDGVATRAQDFVTDGVLRGYALDTYSGCRLGLATTANAGGVRNPRIEPGPEQRDRAAMLDALGTGLLVTELLGQGVNLVTGDYSRGAAGFWVENGEICYPVEEITIAGHLREMFLGLIAVGDDRDMTGSIDTGSWLIERMTIAGE